MITPRWRKVFRDLWSNKTRTVLVLLSIAVGVSAIGMVMGAQSIVDRSLPDAYAATNPASATVFTLNTFGDDLVESIEAMPEIAEAEARRSVNVRFQNEDEESYTLQLTAIPDFDEITINKVKPEEGAYPPEEREFLLERASRVASVGLGDIEFGDTLEVESPSGKKRTLEFTGTVHDMNQFPTFMSGTGYGYITFDTLEWMGEPRNYNQLVFVVSENRDDIDHVNAVAKELEKRMASSGTDVIFTLVFTPGEHPFQSFIDALSLVLGGIGILSLILSGFLIVNTLSAILAQHVRQIGIMKSIGARTDQITRMYVFMVILFGVLALFIAIPAGMLGAAGLSRLFAGFINFDPAGMTLEPNIVIIQAVIAIVVPLLAALIPIFRGVRVTVREAISEVGLGKGQFGSSSIDRLIMGARRVVPMERPMQISLRNTFRRKARLSLTLITLSVASTIFIAIFSIRASLQQTLDETMAYFDYDVQVIFDRPYRTDRITDLLNNFPGIDSVETWGFNSGRIIRDDDTEGESFTIYGPHADTEMVQPIFVEGRWLRPEDANALVVNTDVIKDEEGLGVGSTITVSIDEKESDWVIVGVVRSSMIGPMAFANFDYMSRIQNSIDRAIISQVRLDDRSLDNQLIYGQAIEDAYRDSGFRVQQMQTLGQMQNMISSAFDGIIGFLLAMAVLLGVVGGLGLMGTMSINVLERTREIGVMRAIGASNSSILRIILVEGLIIGLISWTIGGLIALPASRGLTLAIGMALLESAPSYIFSRWGAVLWLGVVLLLALMASFLPARRASRLTVREVLSYE